MWSLHINRGLHAGSVHDIATGKTVLGSGDQADIFLLDDTVPGILAEWMLDESGVLTCVFAHEGLEFSYDGIEWTPSRAELLFSVNLYYQFGTITFSFIRKAAETLTLADTLSNESGDESAGLIDADHAQSRHQHSKATRAPFTPKVLFFVVPDRLLKWSVRFPRLHNALERLSTSPRLQAGLLATVFVGLLFSFWQVVDGVRKPGTSPDDVATVDGASAGKRRGGMVISYELSIGHSAPPGALERDIFDKPFVAETRNDTLTSSDAAGIDNPEAAQSAQAALATPLKISSSLTMGKPVLDADKLAEPALYMLQERLDRQAWGSRVTVNARSRNLIVRAVLSETERREFERLTQQLLREHGSNITFRAIIEPMEAPTQLAIKQVLGGNSPVVILEDGSRLMPGSIYDGKLVESITTDRIVLRGKDRVEIPI